MKCPNMRKIGVSRSLSLQANHIVDEFGAICCAWVLGLLGPWLGVWS